MAAWLRTVSRAVNTRGGSVGSGDLHCYRVAKHTARRRNRYNRREIYDVATGLARLLIAGLILGEKGQGRGSVN